MKMNTTAAVIKELIHTLPAGGLHLVTPVQPIVTLLY